MGAHGDHAGHGLCRGAQPIAGRACGGAERLATHGTQEPLVLACVDTDGALTDLASGRAREMGAEDGCGVHDRPPGVAGEHFQEEYDWTPIFFPSAPHHGLVRSYPMHQMLGNKGIMDLILLILYYHSLAHALQAVKLEMPPGTPSTL